VPLATILTMVEVDADDPAFENPTKFVGPVYEKADADRLAAEKGWIVKQDGQKWRRVVASPVPARIWEIRPIRLLVDAGMVVVCAGGGGIPTMYARDRNRQLIGVEAVVDKDLTSALLARELDADVFVMATDVEAVFEGFGTPQQRRIDRITTAELKPMGFAAGSMGPKVGAAIEFVERTGHRAVIGRLDDIEQLVEGSAGTNVVPAAAPVTA
jgi:carbamate kinase